MSSIETYYQFTLLPPDLQKEVSDFIAFLQSKQPKVSKPSRLKKRQFGCEIGSYYMAPDFDAPLEDFRAYMM